jgi:hypothetical protein
VDPREPLPISLAKEFVEAMSMPSYGTLYEELSPLLPPGSVLPTGTGSLGAERERQNKGVML